MSKLFEVASREELLAVPLGSAAQSGWITIDQAMIDRFADATGDHQWIHVDPQRAAREMPGGKTIAHGYLTLSLLPQLLDDVWTLRNERQSLNYGGERLRFIAPVPSGSRVRLNVSVAEVEARERDEGVRVALDCRIEVEGQERPAISLTMLALFYFAGGAA